jgi:hypothetical protein
MKRVRIYKNNGDVCVYCAMISKNAELSDAEFTYNDSECYLVVDNLDCGNIDVSSTNKDIDKSLRKAITYLVDRGFSGYLTKYNTSGAEFVLQKDGITDTLKLTNRTLNPNKVNILNYMKQFDKSFEMLKELTTLRKSVNESKSNNM